MVDIVVIMKDGRERKFMPALSAGARSVLDVRYEDGMAIISDEMRNETHINIDQISEIRIRQQV